MLKPWLNISRERCEMLSLQGEKFLIPAPNLKSRERMAPYWAHSPDDAFNCPHSFGGHRIYYIYIYIKNIFY